MSNETTTRTTGPSLCVLLAVLFIGLKLAGIITWSWVWVLSPLWLGFVGTLCLLIAIALAAARLHSAGRRR